MSIFVTKFEKFVSPFVTFFYDSKESLKQCRGEAKRSFKISL